MIITPLRLAAARIGRVLGVLARQLRGGRGSAALALVLVLIGFWVLPIHLGTAKATQFWKTPAGALSLPPGTELPVFCMPPAGIATRCGIAKTMAPNRVTFQPYGNFNSGHESIPVLAGSDMGLLWAMGDPRGKLMVRDSAVALVRQAIGNVHELTKTPLWQREYRPATRTLLDRVAIEAWHAPDTQGALQALIVAMEPVVRKSVANDIGPVIGTYMVDAVWRVVKSNAAHIFSLITGDPLDLSSLGSAVNAALRDPAIQPALSRLGPKILAMPETELLTERFVSNLAEAVEHDPMTFELLSRIVSDPRLGREVGGVRTNAASFMRHIGQVLWGIGDNQSLNSLAGMALKTTINGTSLPLILLLDVDHAVALAQDMPGGVTILVPDIRP